MNNKKIITILVVIALICGGSGLAFYISIFKKISFSFVNELSIEIYTTQKGVKKVVKTIKQSDSVYLKKDSYCVVSISDKYSKEPECFFVNKEDLSINIDPDYSDSYLKEKLTSELPIIKSVIREKYGLLLDRFIIDDGRLFKKGEWYATVLDEVLSPGLIGDKYRIILNYKDDVWQVAAYPQLSLSTLDYPDIPFNILSDTNKFIGDL